MTWDAWGERIPLTAIHVSHLLKHILPIAVAARDLATRLLTLGALLLCSLKIARLWRREPRRSTELMALL